MTSILMKALSHPVSMTKTWWVMGAAIALLAAPVASAWAARAARAAGCGASNASSPYPTFCKIPVAPTDVRTAAAFKSAVVDIRQEGRRVARQSGPDAFGLPSGGADAFARAARSEIAESARGVEPVAKDTDAFAAEARRAVIPPTKAPRKTP
jgi:hypothetical protein